MASIWEEATRAGTHRAIAPVTQNRSRTHYTQRYQMNQTHYDQLLNTLHAMGYTDYRSRDETFALHNELTRWVSSPRPTRSPRWLRREIPYTPARGSTSYVEALTQLVNRLR